MSSLNVKTMSMLFAAIAAAATVLTIAMPFAFADSLGKRMKAVANAAMDKSTDDALRFELMTLRQHLRSRDMSEGLAAFREKRPPNFVGE